MDSPLQGTSRLASGNLTLSFKTAAEALKARSHAEHWVKFIDPAASYPQRAYAVVAHNVPADIWPKGSNITDAIQTLEDCNPDPLTYVVNSPCIANLAWLNSIDFRERNNTSSLMIIFTTKVNANHAIENRRIIEGTVCNVSIYIPRPPQCFWCQDWGHQATGCTREAHCG